MQWILLWITVSSSVMQGMLMDRYSKKRMRTQADLYFFHVLANGVAAIAMLLYGGIPKISGFTFVLGIAFGAATNFSAVFKMFALRLGSLSYTTLIVSSSMLIPALSGALFWQEELTVLTAIGAGCMLISVALSVEYRRGQRITWKWLVCTALSFLMGGCIGVMQKVLSYSDYSTEQNGFLLVALLFSTLFAAGGYLWARRGKKEELTLRRDKSLFLSAGATGVGITLTNVICLYLAGVMPALLFFPLVNGGVILLTAAASFLLFRERLHRWQTVGFCVGVLAIFLLCFG